MISLLSRLPTLVTPANTVAAETADELAMSDTIGFIVLAVIVGPVILLTIAAIFGSPRTFRVPGLFIGSLIFLIGAIILSFAAVSALLRFVIPQ